MARYKRIAVCLAVIVHLAGCTGAELSTLPRDGVGVPPAAGAVRAVRFGDYVVVELISGETVKGEVVAVAPSSITVARIGNDGRQKRTIASTEIRSLERVTPGNTWLVVGGIAVGVLGLLIHNFAEYDWN